MSPWLSNTSSTSLVSRHLRRRGGGGIGFIANTSSELAPPFSSSFSTSAPAVSTISKPQEKEKGLGWTRFLLFIPGAITFGLGTWQIYRRHDKINMLEYRKNKLATEPINCNSINLSKENLDALEFRRLACEGVFDEEKSIYVGPRSRSISGVTENGYYVITPLMPIPDNPRSAQSPILVNRGWVPRNWKDKPSKNLIDDERPSAINLPTSGESRSSWWRFQSKKPDIVQVPDVIPVEVVGVVRGSEKPSVFVPANDPSSSQWFYVDVPAIADACGLPENTIYIEDINESVNPANPYPLPKDPNTLIKSSVMPQDHLNYTFTWYSLSAAVTYMAFKRLVPKKSRIRV